MSRSFARPLASFLVLGLSVAGCSLLVSSAVPDFRCSSTDPSSCAEGFVCDVVTQACVADAGSAPLVEDAGDEEDVPPLADDAGDGGPIGPQPLGSKCRIASDCTSKLCGSSTILTTTITETTGPICTVPCCTSNDCPSSFVCFNGGTGGGYCVPSALAKRSPPASGGKGGGLACSTNTECRSGLCTGSPKVCLDTCCVLGDCGGSTTCRVDSVSAPGPERIIWVCARPTTTGTKAAGEVCDSNAECASDSCIGFGTKLCRPPCSNTPSCKVYPKFQDGHCRYTTDTEPLKFCETTTAMMRLAAGASCTDHIACQSDYCDTERKTCANVCGKDSDCALTEVCRPSATNTPYLRCVPKE